MFWKKYLPLGIIVFSASFYVNEKKFFGSQMLRIFSGNSFFIKILFRILS